MQHLPVLGLARFNIILLNEPPIDDFPELIEIILSEVLSVKIIGVFPHIAA